MGKHYLVTVRGTWRGQPVLVNRGPYSRPIATVLAWWLGIGRDFTAQIQDMREKGK